MQVYLVTFGSRGDVHPLLGLGQALRARGHAATVLTNPVFAEDVARAGLGFVPVGSAQDYRDTLAHPKLWHPVDGLGVLWRYLLRPALQPTLDSLQALCQGCPGDAPLVLASPLAMGARVAQEALGLRLVSLYTAPTLLRSVADPLTIGRWQVPRLVPAWARHGLWQLLDRTRLDPLVRPALALLRTARGLPPLPRHGLFNRWLHAPLGGLALFPSWFARHAPDWPVPVQEGDFPLYDEPPPAKEAAPLLQSLQRFLEAGSPPVVFMPGSARQDAASFFRAAIAACERLGQRAVLLGPDAPAHGESLSDACWSAPYVPFAQMLPRARALVHHGGIGSCAQALRAGLPQLLWPQAYDQHDNALRLQALGVAARLPGQAPDAATLARQLGRLLRSTDIAAACSRQAAALQGPRLGAACAWLETLA